MYEPKIEKEFLCPLEYGLTVFGGKWKSRIVCVLSNTDVMRYSAIRKELGNITDAVLAAMLKELLNDGLIQRKQYDTMPPKVEYSLTKKGQSVLPIFQGICQWSRENTVCNLEEVLSPCKNCAQLKNKGVAV